jgi:hypothetical protein
VSRASRLTQALETGPRLVIATPPMFGARRTERQPRRLRSPTLPCFAAERE